MTDSVLCENMTDRENRKLCLIGLQVSSLTILQCNLIRRDRHTSLVLNTWGDNVCMRGVDSGIR